MKPLSGRVGLFTDSVIRRMTRISDEYDAINLSQGFPDFDPPRELMDALARVAYEGPHQYSVTYGAPNLRAALAEKYRRTTGVEADPETQVLVTCGGTEAMMSAMMALCDPGDRVLVFSPFYENYGADAILSGAEPIYIPLVPPDYRFDPALIEEGFRAGAKAIVICNPSNPCGKVFTREELQIIADLAIRYDIYVITDEVYEHIVYAPHRHCYLSTLPGMRERTIICSSLSKTYSITGWRLGYVIAPPEITERVKQVHDFLTVGAAAPLMEAAVVGLHFEDQYYLDLQAHYTHMKDLFVGGMRELGLSVTDPEGAYYVLMDISEYGYDDDEQFCIDLCEKVGVAAVPGSSFFKEDVHHLIRFHFAKKDETLLAALERLSRIQTMRK